MGETRRGEGTLKGKRLRGVRVLRGGGGGEFGREIDLQGEGTWRVELRSRRERLGGLIHPEGGAKTQREDSEERLRGGDTERGGELVFALRW